MTHGANTAHGMNTVTNSRFAFFYPAIVGTCLVFRVSHAPEMSRDGVTICAGRDWEYGDTAR